MRDLVNEGRNLQDKFKKRIEEKNNRIKSGSGINKS